MASMATAFNGDTIVSDTVTKLIEELRIECIIETGTFKGDTTSFLAEKFPGLEIHTIEVNIQNFLFSEKRFKPFKNIKQYCGSSEKILSEILPNLREKRILFYLDAHWQDYWPLLDELKEIKKNNSNNCCIVIDDFKVPNRTFQHDSYKGQALDIDYITRSLKEIYSSPFYFFNDKSTRKYKTVGKIYCFPEEWKSMLTLTLTKESSFFYLQ